MRVEVRAPFLAQRCTFLSYELKAVINFIFSHAHQATYEPSWDLLHPSHPTRYCHPCTLCWLHPTYSVWTHPPTGRSRGRQQDARSVRARAKPRQACRIQARPAKSWRPYLVCSSSPSGAPVARISSRFSTASRATESAVRPTTPGFTLLALPGWHKPWIRKELEHTMRLTQLH